MAFNTIITDHFTGANNTDLKNHNPDVGGVGSWLKRSGSSAICEIESNTLQICSFGGDDAYYENNTKIIKDVGIKFVASSGWTTGSNICIIGARLTWNTNFVNSKQYYWSVTSGTNTINYQISGSHVILKSFSLTLVNGHTYEYRIIGNNHGIYDNGVLVAASACVDGALASGTIGIYAQGNVCSGYMDDLNVYEYLDNQDITDFEATGVNGWAYTAPDADDQGHGLTTAQARSATHSYFLAGGDSGDPDYTLENVNIHKTIVCIDGSLTFWAKSTAYDSYLYVTIDGVTKIASTLVNKVGFTQYTVPVTAGSHEIKIWSDWIADGGVNGAGIYVDDISVSMNPATASTGGFFMVM